jgi:ADP-L-glycero-D-manno-heptose 6-epimerase
MIYVTGAFGFIGQNYVKLLNKKGLNVVISNKFNYVPKILTSKDTVVHLGAQTDTTAGWRDVLYNNTTYTIKLFNACRRAKCKFIYASSAAVYGNGGMPLNAYGWSKLLADWYINGRAVGLRFFNVYGPFEEHKGNMKSFISKMRDGQKVLFEGTVNHKRDYVHVTDVCKVIDFFNDCFNGLYSSQEQIEKAVKQANDEYQEKNQIRILQGDCLEILKRRKNINS